MSIRDLPADYFERGGEVANATEVAATPEATPEATTEYQATPGVEARNADIFYDQPGAGLTFRAAGPLHFYSATPPQQYTIAPAPTPNIMDTLADVGRVRTALARFGLTINDLATACDDANTDTTITRFLRAVAVHLSRRPNYNRNELHDVQDRPGQPIDFDLMQPAIIREAVRTAEVSMQLAMEGARADNLPADDVWDRYQEAVISLFSIRIREERLTSQQVTMIEDGLRSGGYNLFTGWSRMAATCDAMRAGWHFAGTPDSGIDDDLVRGLVDQVVAYAVQMSGYGLPHDMDYIRKSLARCVGIMARYNTRPAGPGMAWTDIPPRPVSNEFTVLHANADTRAALGFDPDLARWLMHVVNAVNRVPEDIETLPLYRAPSRGTITRIGAGITIEIPYPVDGDVVLVGPFEGPTWQGTVVGLSENGFHVTRNPDPQTLDEMEYTCVPAMHLLVIGHRIPEVAPFVRPR